MICGAGCQCPTRVSSKSVLQECQERVSVGEEVSNKSVLQACQVRSVKQECFTRVTSKSVSQECQVRVSQKKCQVRSAK